MTLLDNGTDSLTVTANGTFTFKTALASGATYSVTVGTQPTGETCTVTNGSGTVGTSNVTNVAVACSPGTGGGGVLDPLFGIPDPQRNSGRKERPVPDPLGQADLGARSNFCNHGHDPASRGSEPKFP